MTARSTGTPRKRPRRLLVAALGLVSSLTVLIGHAERAAAAVAPACALDGAGNLRGLTGAGPDPIFQASIGTLRALMLFVDFSDAPHVETTTSLYDGIVPGARGWLAEVSYGRFDVSVARMTGAPWLRMPRLSTFYGLDDGTTFFEHRAFFSDAVNAAGGAVDFHGVDLLYVVPARGAAIPLSAAFTAPAGSGIVAPGGVELRAGVSLGDDIRFPRPGYGAWVMAHETSHTLGLPDLYEYGADYPELHRFVGSWDVMGRVQQGPHLTAWQKVHLGWLDAAQAPCVETSGTYVLTPLEQAGGVKAIVLRTGPSTAIVAEDRQLSGRDGALCDHGLLVYQVDATVPTGAGPVRVRQSGVGQDIDPVALDTCGLRYNATFDARPGKTDTFDDRATGVTIHITSSLAGGPITVDVTRQAPRSVYVPLQPERLLDTRASGPQVRYVGDKPAAGQTVFLQVTGEGGAVVPATASAVVLNVTGVDASADGYVTVWPCGAARPTASNLNLTRGAIAANLVVSKVGAGGMVCLFTQSGTDLVTDLDGYYTAGDAYHPLQPERLLETRRGAGQKGYVGAKPAADQVVTLTVAGAGASQVPVDATAVVLNVTGIDAVADGYVTVWPCGTPRPTASNLNLTAGTVTPNLVVSKVGTGGTVCLYTQQSADLVADVSGYYGAGDAYRALQPERLLETRSGAGQTGYAGPKPVSGQTVRLQVTGAGATRVPADARAVVLNVTGVDATADGFITVWPCDAPRPTASNLNLVRGATRANLVISKIAADGSVCLFTLTGAHLVADVNGYDPAG